MGDIVANQAYGQDECGDLPPGFRFHPTDLEIIESYLWQKVLDGSFSARAIGEVDFNICEPWDLPSKAKMGEKHWYFFFRRDRKYPTGTRTNRATKAGYWKATGKDKEIHSKGRRSQLVGMKKTLVFYTGRAPKGLKTNWVMHEYRLEGKSSYANLPTPVRDEWVVARVFHKNATEESKRNPRSDGMTGTNSHTCDVGEFFPSTNPPPLALVDDLFHKTNWADVSSIDAYNNGGGGDHVSNFKGTVMLPFPHTSNYNHQVTPPLPQLVPPSTQFAPLLGPAGTGSNNNSDGWRNGGALSAGFDNRRAILRPGPPGGPGHGRQEGRMVIPKLECVLEPYPRQLPPAVNAAPGVQRETGTSVARSTAPRQEMEGITHCDDLASLLNSVDQFQSIDICWDEDQEPYLQYKDS